jgi:hypothetical protein
MPNGVVLIDRWSLRVVGAERVPLGGNPARDALAREWLFAQESGGELAHASWPDGTSWSAPLGALHLTAVTHSHAPSAGTRIRLAGTDYEGITDPRGVVDFDDLVPGPYTLMVVDSALATIDIAIETSFQFIAARDSVLYTTIELPTAEDYARMQCGGRRADSTYIVGRVVTEDGLPVEGVKVNIEIEDRAFVWRPAGRVWYTTGGNGLFYFCPSILSRHQRVRLVGPKSATHPALEVRTLDAPVTVVRMVVDGSPEQATRVPPGSSPRP